MDLFNGSSWIFNRCSRVLMIPRSTWRAKRKPRRDRCLATRAWYRGSRATSEGRPGHCYTQCCPPDFSKGKGADAFMMMNRIFCDCSGVFWGIWWDLMGFDGWFQWFIAKQNGQMVLVDAMGCTNGMGIGQRTAVLRNRKCHGGHGSPWKYAFGL